MAHITQVEQFEFHQTLESSRGEAVVFFTSEECSACKYWEKLLKELPHAGLEVYKIDAGKDQALTEEFGVFHLPALYLYRDGAFHSELQCEANAHSLEQTIEDSLASPAQESP